MKIVLDRPRCEGHGLCEEAAPEPDAPRRRRRAGPRPRGGRASADVAAAERRRPGVPGRGAEASHERADRAASSSSATASPGLTAADTLRGAGFDGELTIVGDEHARGVQPPGPVEGAAARRRRHVVARARADRPRRDRAPGRTRDSDSTSTAGASHSTTARSCRTTASSSPPAPGRAGCPALAGESHPARPRRRARPARAAGGAAVGRRGRRGPARHGDRLGLPGRRLPRSPSSPRACR